MVDRRPAGVVDAGHDPLDAEVLAGDPSDEHVGVVAARHRRHRGRPLDPRLDQPVAVEPDALDGLAAEVVAEPVERLAPAVDDRHGVPEVEQGVAERRAHAPASDDHDVHRGEHRHAARRHASSRVPLRMVSVAKRVLIGKPIATSEEHHQKLSKRVALPIFASDAVSSTAYATDEIILVLTLQAGIGAAAWGYLTPIAIVVADPAGHRRGVVPPDDLRLPIRWRRLRRVAGEPRARCRRWWPGHRC